jgi:hypothetical protein
MQRRAQVWISAVIYTLIIVTALMIILAATQPMIERMRDKAAVQKQKEMMIALDEQISSVASEGPGSQRAVPIDIADGEIVVAEDGLAYNIETSSKVIEPRSQLTLGNLAIGSGSDVNAYENNTAYIMENSRIRVEMIKTSDLNYTYQIIKKMTLIENGISSSDTFSFDIGNGTALLDGSYTKLDSEVKDGATASLTAHCNQSKNEYDLVFTLDSEADFMKVDLNNRVRR